MSENNHTTELRVRVYTKKKNNVSVWLTFFFSPFPYLLAGDLERYGDRERERE